MKKLLVLLFSVVLSLCLIGCGSSNDTTAATTENLTDVDFIVNLGKALENRWKHTDSFTDDQINAMSVSELQNYDQESVNAELNTLMSLDKYTFENADLKELAEEYFNALELQNEGVKYIGTDFYEECNSTWQLGYAYRTVLIKQFVDNYGLTVSSKYQTILDDFLADAETAKQTVAIQEYANDLPNQLNYQLDESQENEYSDWHTYKAIVENTTDYTLDSVIIDINLLDQAGIIIDQTSSYINGLKPGDKVYSTFSTDKDFDSLDFAVTIY